MMDDEITIEGVSALLIQLAAVQMERDEERARADELAGDLSELRENVLLGLGMTAEAVASMDADGMESSITDLLAGHGELVAEVAWLKATLAEVDLSEWEDARLREWLPGAAEVEMVARLESRAENWKDAAAGLRAEVERLEAENAAYRSEWRAWRALSRLNIEYDGSDPLERLAEEIAALRAQMLLDSDQGYELARLSALTGISLHSTNPHEMTEEFAAAVVALRAQLDAGDDAMLSLLGISCVYSELDGTILRTADGRPKLLRWDKEAAEPAFKILEMHGRLENLGNGTFVALPAPPQE